jgi:hypothetical protein
VVSALLHNGQLDALLPVTVGDGFNFKGLSLEGVRADFSKNLHASLFNDDIYEPNFGRIHLAGQYLKGLPQVKASLLHYSVFPIYFFINTFFVD